MEEKESEIDQKETEYKDDEEKWETIKGKLQRQLKVLEDEK